jgi:hypothetical protein
VGEAYPFILTKLKLPIYPSLRLGIKTIRIPHRWFPQQYNITSHSNWWSNSCPNFFPYTYTVKGFQRFSAVKMQIRLAFFLGWWEQEHNFRRCQSRKWLQMIHSVHSLECAHVILVICAKHATCNPLYIAMLLSMLRRVSNGGMTQWSLLTFASPLSIGSRDWPTRSCTADVIGIVSLLNHHLLALLPGPTFNFVGRNCDSMGVVMETHNIPPGESSSQVRVLEQLK